MILKDYIILKLGQQNIASVLFSLDLITDIIIDPFPGYFSRISGSFDFFSIAAYNSSILCSAAVHAIRAYPLSSF